MDGQEICTNVASLSESVSSVALIEGGSLRAIHVRSGALTPKNERFETTVAQSEFFTNIFRKNEDSLGKFHFVTAHYNNSDLLLFPILINGRNFILAVIALKPYGTELTEKIRQYIGEMRLAR